MPGQQVVFANPAAMKHKTIQLILIRNKYHQRWFPLENESHVRNAIARFNQVQGLSNAERDMAWKRIKASAKKFDFHISETSWHEIGLKHAPANKTHK